METKVFFSGIKQQILKCINEAKVEMVIAVAWFTDTSIIEALLKKVKEDGVKVWILFYDDKVNKKDLFVDLYKAGAKIRYSKVLMHNKFCVIDRRVVINGSYNWTQNAEMYNKENVQISYGAGDLSCHFLDEFKEIFERSVDFELYVKDLSKLYEEMNELLEKIWIEYKGKYIYPNRYPTILKIEAYKKGKNFWLSRVYTQYEWDFKYHMNSVTQIDKLEKAVCYKVIRDEKGMDSVIKEIFTRIERSEEFGYESRYIDKMKFFTLKSKGGAVKEMIQYAIDHLNVLDYRGGFNNVYLSVVEDDLIYDIYNVDKEVEMYSGFNDMKYGYIYPRKNFLVLEDVRKYKSSRPGDYICTVLTPEFKKVNYDVMSNAYIYHSLIQIENGSFLCCKYNKEIGRARRVYVNTQEQIEIPIPEGYYPERYINRHVIVSCLVPVFWEEKAKVYNIVNQEGVLQFKREEYQRGVNNEKSNYFYCYYEILQPDMKVVFYKLNIIHFHDPAKYTLEKVKEMVSNQNRSIISANKRNEDAHISDILRGYEKIVYNTKTKNVEEKEGLVSSTYYGDINKGLGVIFASFCVFIWLLFRACS